MATKLNYICDICATIKGVANKWWVIRAGPFNFSISHFSEERAKEPDNLLACSSSCLNKTVSRWCDEMTKSEAAPSILLTGQSNIDKQ